MNDPAPYPDFDGTQPCAYEDPERFHADHPGPQALADTKAVCTGDDDHPRCSYLDECLAYALTHRVTGIWAATTDTQRRGMRRHLRIVPSQVTFTNANRCRRAS